LQFINGVVKSGVVEKILNWAKFKQESVLAKSTGGQKVGVEHSRLYEGFLLYRLLDMDRGKTMHAEITAIWDSEAGRCEYGGYTRQPQMHTYSY
jgi:hypothetical protein